jgi:hypothetical protein
MATNLRIWLKWTLLVWLNAAFSFFVSINEYPQTPDRIGIICGVFTFVALYTATDFYLLKQTKLQLSKALFISALLKLLSQLYPGLELLTGLTAITWVEKSIGEIAFVSAYVITLIDGLLLSSLVMIMTFLTHLIMRKFIKKTV